MCARVCRSVPFRRACTRCCGMGAPPGLDTLTSPCTNHPPYDSPHPLPQDDFDFLRDLTDKKLLPIDLVLGFKYSIIPAAEKQAKEAMARSGGMTSPASHCRRTGGYAGRCRHGKIDSCTLRDARPLPHPQVQRQGSCQPCSPRRAAALPQQVAAVDASRGMGLK